MRGGANNLRRGMALGLGISPVFGGKPSTFNFGAYPGYAIHHAARKETTAYADTDPVATITDFAGVAQSPTAAGAGRPTYRTAVQNGKPTFRFDGVDDSAVYVAAVLNPRLTSISVCCVVRIPAADTGNRQIYGVDELTEGVQFSLRGDTGGVALAFIRDGAGASAIATGTTDLRGAFHQVTFLWDLASKRVTLRVNGVQEATQANASINTATIPAGFVDLGVATRGGAPRAATWFKDDIAEVIGYESLLAGAGLTSVEAALKAIWGTP